MTCRRGSAGRSAGALILGHSVRAVIALIFAITITLGYGVAPASAGPTPSPASLPGYSYDSGVAATTPSANRGPDAARGGQTSIGSSGSSTSLTPRFLATKAGEEGLEGISRSYVNITKGSSIRNVGTNASHTEFADSLTKGGWAARTSKDGNVQVFAKDGAKYVLRSKNSSNYPGWTADFTPAGSARHSLEIRLGYRP